MRFARINDILKSRGDRMKSIKRGRASSMTSGIVGIVMSMVFFGMAMQVSDSFGEFAFMPMIMGLIVLGASIAEIIGATRKNRFSEYDITDDGEEPDPLNQYYGGQAQSTQNWQSPTSAPASPPARPSRDWRTPSLATWGTSRGAAWGPIRSSPTAWEAPAFPAGPWSASRPCAP